jgi:hypothetical protein
MFSSGKRRRYLSDATGSGGPLRSPHVPSPNDVVKVRKGRKLTASPEGEAQHTYGENPTYQRGHGAVVRGNIGGPSDSGGIQPSGGSTGFGPSSGKVDRYNPVFDDLSRGTVAEDWIPRDPRLQNRMFRIMYSRDDVAGPAVDLFAENCWSDFDLTGVRDKAMLDTFYAAKENTKVDRMLEGMTKEFLVTGRVVSQCILDTGPGLWSDVMVFNGDYLKVGGIPRTGFMPKVDLVPDPLLREWVRSTDQRDIESRQGVPQSLLDLLGSSKPVPLDPLITSYLPRQSFLDDVNGTSWYVRNILTWAFEKSLINATLTGHRRRAGPIMQIAVGSDTWEPTPEQIDALCSLYITCEDDTVNSVIGTRNDVVFNQIRGGLNEMWKWSDESEALYQRKLRIFQVTEQMLTGDGILDVTSAPTGYLERLRAHRKYMTENFLMAKFFRGISQVHGFVKRSPAELSHRIRVQNNEAELVMPTIVYHRSLEAAADTNRLSLLDEMETHSIPVGLEEWSRAYGAGDYTDRMKATAHDIELRLRSLRLTRLRKKVGELTENAGDLDNLEEEVGKALVELDKIKFAEDDENYQVADLDEAGKERAEDMADGTAEGVEGEPLPSAETQVPASYLAMGSAARRKASVRLARPVVASSVIRPSPKDLRINGDAFHDLRRASGRALADPYRDTQGDPDPTGT